MANSENTYERVEGKDCEGNDQNFGNEGCYEGEIDKGPESPGNHVLLQETASLDTREDFGIVIFSLDPKEDSRLRIGDCIMYSALSKDASFRHKTVPGPCYGQPLIDEHFCLDSSDGVKIYDEILCSHPAAFHLERDLQGMLCTRYVVVVN